MPEALPRFFASAAQFRAWLVKHHATSRELWIAFWKMHTGRRGLTYHEAVDEALCYGWIDGLKKRHDDAAFIQRFTPRRARSIWSAVNVRKVEALRKAGRMASAGLEAYALRDPARTAIYSSEGRNVALDPALEAALRARKKAWAFFEAQPPGYRRRAIHWVMSAKRDATRRQRMHRLVADCARGERVGAVTGK